MHWIGVGKHKGSKESSSDFEVSKRSNCDYLLTFVLKSIDEKLLVLAGVESLDIRTFTNSRGFVTSFISQLFS